MRDPLWLHSVRILIKVLSKHYDPNKPIDKIVDESAKDLEMLNMKVDKRELERFLIEHEYTIQRKVEKEN